MNKLKTKLVNKQSLWSMVWMRTRVQFRVNFYVTTKKTVMPFRWIRDLSCPKSPNNEIDSCKNWHANTNRCVTQKRTNRLRVFFFFFCRWKTETVVNIQTTTVHKTNRHIGVWECFCEKCIIISIVLTIPWQLQAWQTQRISFQFERESVADYKQKKFHVSNTLICIRCSSTSIVELPCSAACHQECNCYFAFIDP